MMNIERAIKKNIWSKEHTYFLSVQPGLEEILAQEIEGLGFCIKERVVGGVEVQGKLETLYALHLQTRVANKILFRLLSFKATHLSEIKKHIKKLPLHLFWKTGTAFDVSVQSRGSKLYHTDMVKEFIAKGIENDAKEMGFSFIWDKKSLEKLFVRIENNVVTISLDSSGDFLYKRNIKKQVNKAPIRENIAAALLLKYWNQELPLWDPMCGSGTFILEAAMMNHGVAPNLFRGFQCMEWVSFREKTFQFLVKKYKEAIKESQTLLLASDIDPLYVDYTRENLYLFDNISFQCENFFDILPSVKKGLLVMNLPYNKRIKVEKGFYSKVEAKLLTDFKGWEYLLLVSSDVVFKNLEKSKLRIKNGGIPLHVYHGVLA